MSFTQIHSWSATAGTDAPVTSTEEFSGTGRSDLSEAVPAATDTEFVWACDVSEVAAIFILASVDLTIETNSGSAADDSLTMKAGVPYEWNASSAATFALGTDVTSIFVTAATAGTLEIRCLYDVTP